MVRTLGAALAVVSLAWLWALRGDADDRAFAQGTTYLTAAIAAGYMVASMVLLRRRKPGRGDLFFVRYGGILLLLAGVGAYYFMANVSSSVEVVQP